MLPRLVFDDALVEAAVARGAEFRRHRVREMLVRTDRVVLDGQIAARVVIGADGANSTVRRLLRRPAAPPAATAVAIRGYAATTPDPERDDHRVRPGPLPGLRAGRSRWPTGGRTSGTASSTGAAAATGGPTSTRCAPCCRGRNRIPRRSAVTTCRSPRGPRFHPDGRVLLAGDAAATVNPLTGEGIFDAVGSGVLAGRAALLGAQAGAGHRAAMRRSFGRHHRHSAAMARLAARPIFLDAAVSAAAAHRSVFDAAVRLGLGRGTVPPTALALILAHLVRGR